MDKYRKIDTYASDEESQSNTSGGSSLTSDVMDNPQAGPSSNVNPAPSTSGTQRNVCSTTSNRSSSGTNAGNNFQEGTLRPTNITNTNASSNRNKRRNRVQISNYFTTGTLNVGGQEHAMVVFNLDNPHRLVAFRDSHQSSNYEREPLVLTHTGRRIFMDASLPMQIASFVNNQNQSSDPENVPSISSGIDLMDIPTLREQNVIETTDHTAKETYPNLFYPEPSLESDDSDDVAAGRKSEHIKDSASVGDLQEQILSLAVSKRKIEHKEEHKPKKPKLEGTGDDKDDSSGSN